MNSSNSESKTDAIVFIGDKPFMNYVTAVVVQFTEKGESEVTIKARGKFISRAVDVAEVSRRRFLEKENIDVKDIQIGSEEFQREGKTTNISNIAITLVRK
ncbi:DNA-binding protein Alba [Candidatus Pacearchaeota archaeon]|nr:DNA-binding protein Alba [Candidatus Pacearchaeota archaeon]